MVLSAPHFFYVCGGGCSNNSNAEYTYFVEIGIIPKSVCDSAQNKLKGYLDYARIKNIRKDLYNERVPGGYEYESGVSLDEIRNIVKETFTDPLELKNTLSSLENSDNGIFLFTLKQAVVNGKYSPDKYNAYMYFERE